MLLAGMWAQRRAATGPKPDSEQKPLLTPGSASFGGLAEMSWLGAVVVWQTVVSFPRPVFAQVSWPSGPMLLPTIRTDESKSSPLAPTLMLRDWF